MSLQRGATVLKDICLDAEVFAQYTMSPWCAAVLGCSRVLLLMKILQFYNKLFSTEKRSQLITCRELSRVVHCCCALFLGVAASSSVTRAEPSTNAAQLEFRFPHRAFYQLYNAKSSDKTSRPLWIKAWPSTSATNAVEFGSRVVVQVRDATALDRLIAARPLKLSRTVAANVFILDAPDAITAVEEANRLAQSPEVSAAYPVVRKPGQLNGPYAAQPTDSLFLWQWNLENRNPDGSPYAPDINVRAAWPYTRGEGITVAVADTGVEFTHPELVSRVAGAPHWNFANNTTNAGPLNDYSDGAHGTEVAGLIAASLGNARMVGVAPAAHLASWEIFQSSGPLVSDEQLMDMFQYQSNQVQVQNHSWGSQGHPLGEVTLLEEIGISNAITSGRFGKGVVMVRAAGNGRVSVINADSDGYISDPRVIPVAATRSDGRVASYSQPGACVLVAAPSGDYNAGFPGLFTTDLLGTRGVNQINFFPPYEDLSGYAFDSMAFSGTSASAPEISGIAALMLSANTNLTYRDVQQVLLLSCRHYDFLDPDLRTNGAGLLVSHNVGFGIPDAGAVVDLARQWVNRPAQTNVTLTSTQPALIPDAGLRVVVTGAGGVTLASIPALSGTGLHVENSTAAVPLVDLGYGTNRPAMSLTNKAALIQRDTATFTPKINLAAQAGAAFTIIYNFATNALGSGPPGGDYLVVTATDFAPVPSVFIGHDDGETLKQLFQTNQDALAQVRLVSTSYVFSVTNTLLCEQVGLRVMADHQRRGDLRITLVSPAGTRSVLQQYGFDTAPGPTDWTYYSTHHFYESSAGTWTAYFSDEAVGATGSIQTVSLVLLGVPITDTDRDGLDDAWELAHFGGLQMGPKDDPDKDGYSNAREQIMGTDPTVANDSSLAADLSVWRPGIARLSWPSSPSNTYEVWGGTAPQALSLITTVPGRFRETEWFTPSNSLPAQFFQVRSRPNQ